MKRTVLKVLCIIIISSFVLSTFAFAEQSYSDLFNNNSQPIQVKEYKQKFWDVDKSHWAFNAIAELTDRGAINGYSDGSFKPEKTVSRAEWAKIMIQAAGLSANDYSVKFTDMNRHWGTPYVNAASNYLTAFSDGSYRPDQAVTREDVTMAMVKLKGYDLNEVDYSVLSKFRDVASISNSIKVYVSIAVEKGLINGFDDGTFRGQATLTRAEAATLLWRAFQYGNDNKGVAASSSVYSESYTNNNNTVYQLGDSSNIEMENVTQNLSTLTINDLNGRFWDEFSIRAFMDIKKKNDIYKINIMYTFGAQETNEWFFNAKIDKSTGKLIYQNGFEYMRIDKDDGTTEYTLINDKCEGEFVFSDNLLIWNDFSEDISSRYKFKKGDNSDERDYEAIYDAAVMELSKYLESYGHIDEKRFNLIRGMLLDCFGYSDSDQLLDKFISIHNIALKIPKMLTESEVKHYSSFWRGIDFDAIMRDTMLFVEQNRFFSDTNAELKFKYKYDYTEFSFDITDVYSYELGIKCVRMFVGLFAENYKNEEFARLLNEAFSASSSYVPNEFEMYYGGYNLKIVFERSSGGYVNVHISGRKN